MLPAVVGEVNTTARISGDGAAVPLDIAQQNAGLGQIAKVEWYFLESGR
ncbi:MAG: hypothetical protein R3B93_22290 [Bacteroidia bacterium]